MKAIIRSGINLVLNQSIVKVESITTNKLAKLRRCASRVAYIFFLFEVQTPNPDYLFSATVPFMPSCNVN